MTKSFSVTRHHAFPPVALLAFRFAHAILTWEQRRRTRISLADLDAHMLRDIGVDPAQAAVEIAKPFWQA